MFSKTIPNYAKIKIPNISPLPNSHNVKNIRPDDGLEERPKHVVTFKPHLVNKIIYSQVVFDSLSLSLYLFYNLSMHNALRKSVNIVIYIYYAVLLNNPFHCEKLFPK
jgi:hypothetical protein